MCRALGIKLSDSHLKASTACNSVIFDALESILYPNLFYQQELLVPGDGTAVKIHPSLPDLGIFLSTTISQVLHRCSIGVFQVLLWVFLEALHPGVTLVFPKVLASEQLHRSG